MGMLRAMARFNVTPGKRLNNPPCDVRAGRGFSSPARPAAFKQLQPLQPTRH
jgi:hypothetical protein